MRGLSNDDKRMAISSSINMRLRCVSRVRIAQTLVLSEVDVYLSRQIRSIKGLMYREQAKESLKLNEGLHDS